MMETQKKNMEGGRIKRKRGGTEKGGGEGELERKTKREGEKGASDNGKAQCFMESLTERMMLYFLLLFKYMLIFISVIILMYCVEMILIRSIPFFLHL